MPTLREFYNGTWRLEQLEWHDGVCMHYIARYIIPNEPYTTIEEYSSKSAKDALAKLERKVDREKVAAPG